MGGRKARREGALDAGPAAGSRDNGGSSKSRSTSGRRAKSGGRRGSVLARLFYWSLVLGLWTAIAAVGAVAFVVSTLPPIQSLEVPKRPPTVEIVGLDGKPLAMRGEMSGTDVPIRELPPYLPKAFIAIEDRRFYSHYGVDPFGLVRAAVANVLRRGVSQGGSTITQQLAKNLFLTQERTLWRKMQELVLALWLERKFSKAQILELYLNRVYFGSGAYGVEAAAQRYFGKSARQVKVAEAAMLAGLVKSPSRLAPNRNPAGAERRAQAVLAAMAELGFITETMTKTACAQPAHAVRPAGAGSVNYVADWIMDVLDDLVGRLEQDLVVETSIDPVLQAAAEKALVDELALKGQKLDVAQGAVVAMTPDGAVRALVGGKSYAESQYNRAVVAKRQPGSAFKPFVYLTALERGLTPDSVREDKPIALKGWRPENYGHEYHGAVTLTQALSQSLNTVSVRLTLEVGAGGGGQDRLSPGHRLQARRQPLARARHVGSFAARAHLGLRPVRQRRQRDHAARDRARAQPGRQGAVRARAAKPRPHRRAALRGDDEHDDARDDPERDRAEGAIRGLAGRRQDRHQPGFPRCLVHRLHRPSRRGRLGRQRRFLADQEGDRRRPAGRDLEQADEGRPPGRAGRGPARTGGRRANGFGGPECADATGTRRHPRRRTSRGAGRQAAADRSRHRRLVPRPAVRTALRPRAASPIVVPAQAGTHRATHAGLWDMGPRLRGDDSHMN